MAVENPYDISSYAVLTPQQLLELVFGIIIDNNEQFITPARLRMVLLPLISSYAGRGSAISGQPPISVNQFNGLISIAKASATQDGYISKEDFITAMASAFTKTSELTNDGENGTDPFITLRDIPGNVFEEAIPQSGTTYTFEIDDRWKEKMMQGSGAVTDIVLNDDADLFPVDSVLDFHVYDTDALLNYTSGTEIRYLGNTASADVPIEVGDDCRLKKISVGSIWELIVSNKSTGGSVTPSTLISTDADNALVLGLDNKLFVPEVTGGGVESVTGANVDNTDPLNPIVNDTPIDASGSGTTITAGVIEHNDLIASGSISANGKTKLSQNIIDTESGLYDISSDRQIATYSESEDSFYYANGNLIFNVVVGELLLLGEPIKNQSQNDAIYVKQGVEDATTVVLDSSTLETNYPSSPTGFRVYCQSIIVGAMVYEKTPSGWIGTACIIL